jgi:hypothetical protein
MKCRSRPSLIAARTLLLTAIRSLVPGLLAIAVAASILLLSDLPKSKPAEKQFRVALLQMSSQPIMQEGVEGIVAGLADGGFVEGKNLVLSPFNAEGDMPTANAMAQRVASPEYDLVITVSTPCLQAMAKANQRGTVRHVFGPFDRRRRSGRRAFDPSALHDGHWNAAAGGSVVRDGERDLP